jgi:guanylate kinase
MSSSKDGTMVVLSSPSGAGKTTLVHKISKLKNFIISISHTTRLPRINEKNGKDYFFVNKLKFKKLIKNKEFLEHARVFNNNYGTSKNFVDQNLKKGKNVLFDIDWQGADQIKKKKLNYKLLSFFILPPSKKVLQQRLSNRHKKDKLVVKERMKQFKRDVKRWKNYNFVVINDNLNKCYKQILKIIKAKLKNQKTKYSKKLIKKHVQKLI